VTSSADSGTLTDAEHTDGLGGGDSSTVNSLASTAHKLCCMAALGAGID
jgi:hypothetical protein